MSWNIASFRLNELSKLLYYYSFLYVFYIYLWLLLNSYIARGLSSLVRNLISCLVEIGLVANYLVSIYILKLYSLIYFFKLFYLLFLFN